MHRTFLLTLLIAALLLPTVSLPQPPAEEEARAYGLDERPGVQLPLEALLTDAEGTSRSLEQWLDKPALLLPVYYDCRHVCSRIQGSVATALEAMEWKAGEDFRILSLSFDPADTPETASKARRTYLSAARGAAGADGWRFLTGSEEDVTAILDAAGYRFTRQGEDFLHPVVIFALSPEGRLVRYLHGTRYLPMDLTMALVEARDGKVGRTIRKVLSFCFSYDPKGERYVFRLLRISGLAVGGAALALLLFLLLGGRKRSTPSR